MPTTKNEKQTKRLAFLADRMARLMADVVQMQAEYGPICFDKFYTDEYAGRVRNSKEYEVCLDFVRMMIKNHDKEQENGAEIPEKSSSGGDAATASGSGSEPSSD